MTFLLIIYFYTVLHNTFTRILGHQLRPISQAISDLYDIKVLAKNQTEPYTSPYM